MSPTAAAIRSRVAVRAGALLTGVATLFVLLAASPAVAGGSWFETTQPRYEPGDTVTIVGYTGGGQLGWIEDGPFYGYLRVTPPDGDVTRWPVVAPTDLPLGRLQLDEVGEGWMRLRAMLTFTLPGDLAPGAYDFVYCNDPCTTGLGDLIGGTVYVGVSPASDDAGASTSTTARPSTTRAATTTSAPELAAVATREGGTAAGSSRAGTDSASWVVGAVLLAALIAGVALTLRRRRPADRR